MCIAKRATLEEFRSGTWKKFADDMGIGAPCTRRRGHALAQAMADHAPRVASTLGALGLDEGALGRYSEIICVRAARFANP